MTLQVKVASYAKIPYVGKKLNVFTSRYEPYNKMFGTIHYVKQGDYAIYFYQKNNTITYYRKTNNGSIIPIYDFKRGTFQVFKSKADNYSINGENSLLIKTEDGKYYVVHSGKHLVVLNETDGKTLYKLSVSDQLYCDYFHPIANVVLPVLQVAPEGITITLCNLANDEVHTMSWHPEYMEKLVLILLSADIATEYYRMKGEQGVISKHIKRIVNIILNKDNFVKKLIYRITDINNEYHSIIEEAHEKSKGFYFDKIGYFEFKEIYYMYDINEHGLVYLKGIKINVQVNTLVFDIKIELIGSDIICCLDISNGMLPSPDGPYMRHYGFYEDYDFFVKKYSFDGKINNNYLSSFVFDTKCYYVKSYGCGLTYIKKGEYYKDSCEPSAVYSYKNYWIVINHEESHRRRKLAIIDTKRRLMSVWAIPYSIDKSQYCMQFYILFHYYITKSDKLIFLSRDLGCISIIDGTKIERIFNTREHSECEEKYGDITDLVKCFNIHYLVSKAVEQEYQSAQFVSHRVPITHYMDKKSDKLYIIARYTIDEAIHIGLFVLDISGDNVNLKLLYDKVKKIHRIYHIKFPYNEVEEIHYTYRIKFSKLENEKEFVKNIEKIYWYRLHGSSYDDTKQMMDLDLRYENDYISSIKYNRRSLTFRVIHKCSSLEFHYMTNNLIIVKYQCKKSIIRNLRVIPHCAFF